MTHLEYMYEMERAREIDDANHCNGRNGTDNLGNTYQDGHFSGTWNYVHDKFKNWGNNT